MSLTEDGRSAGGPAPGSEKGSAKIERRSWPGRVIREPLVHFVVLGVAVFGGYRLLDQQPPAPSAQRIEITKEDLRQLVVVWLA
jgi:hypothetical protein